VASGEPDPEARYGLAESATFAFLIALEVLGPRQRAALLLRDVLDHSASDSAEILGTSPGNARILYLRAAASRRDSGVRTEIRLVNGLPAAWITLARPVRRQAPRSLMRIELDAEGRIALVQAILAPRKLSGLRAP